MLYTTFQDSVLLDLNKTIFNGFLPYIGMAAIFVMRPRHEQNNSPPSHIGKTFESIDILLHNPFGILLLNYPQLCSNVDAFGGDLNLLGH